MLVEWVGTRTHCSTLFWGRPCCPFCFSKSREDKPILFHSSPRLRWGRREVTGWTLSLHWFPLVWCCSCTYTSNVTGWLWSQSRAEDRPQDRPQHRPVWQTNSGSPGWGTRGLTENTAPFCLTLSGQRDPRDLCGGSD